MKDFDVTTSEILSELPKLSRGERREILNRLMELDEDADVLRERQQMSDEAFLMLDGLEAQDVQNEAG